MLYQRVVSNYLPDSDYSDYLVDQIQDIGDVCSTTVPNITVREIQTYDTAPSTIAVTTTTTTATAPSNSTCAGQIIGGSSAKKRGALGSLVGLALRSEENLVDLGERQSSSCDSLSTKYGVTTGDLQTLTDSDTCQSTKPVCLPAACKVQKVNDGDTW